MMMSPTYVELLGTTHPNDPNLETNNNHPSSQTPAPTPLNMDNPPSSPWMYFSASLLFRALRRWANSCTFRRASHGKVGEKPGSGRATKPSAGSELGNQWMEMEESGSSMSWPRVQWVDKLT